jgi:hypothetical protein
MAAILSTLLACRGKLNEATAKVADGANYEMQRVGAIKHELRHRSSIEPVFGHFKIDGHPGRKYLTG